MVFEGHRYFLAPCGQRCNSLTVRRKPGEPTRGVLMAGALAMPVALGRGGIKANKREGDGATPRGTFRLKRLWWRADRTPGRDPACRCGASRRDDGWCEDPADRHYNRPVKVPPGSKADRLARQDGLYDFIIEIDHNTRPRVAGRGSAVFIHVARAGLRADRRLRRAHHAGAASPACRTCRPRTRIDDRLTRGNS